MALRYPVITFVFTLLSFAGYAWTYPEHRLIALAAIKDLKLADRRQLDKMWLLARAGYSSRLTEHVIEPDQGITIAQLDYAAWCAIGGDHSFSPGNLLNNALTTDWIINVAKIAAQLKLEIQNAKDAAQHNNALRNSDIKLLRADLDYISRAGSNNAHFLLPRAYSEIGLDAYLKSCLSEGADLNALGLYALFHNRALLKASKCALLDDASPEKPALIRAALADEAFALHFLQDMFAAGHTTGSWGDAALRKGTHDYYNEKGLEVSTWNGKKSVLMGDAYLTDKDMASASLACQLSLEEFIRGVAPPAENNNQEAEPGLQTDFNISTNNFMPAGVYATAAIKNIISHTPIPGLANGLGELPRFRAELGKFWGLSTSLNLTGVSGGFATTQQETGFMGSLEANIRFGFALDGIVNQASDGLVFVQAGWRKDGASSQGIVGNNRLVTGNTLTSAIPSRSAYNFRLRLPFWLVPGDLLIAGPVLYLAAPHRLQNMAEQAANGGLIPWQAGITTRAGRFQFILGRELGVSLYGLDSQSDVLIVPGTSGADVVLVKYKSTKLDFPIVEYRRNRSFSQDQSSSLMYQLSGGVDIPHGAQLLEGSVGNLPRLKHIWYLGLRVLFNYRHYIK